MILLRRRALTGGGMPGPGPGPGGSAAGDLLAHTARITSPMEREDMEDLLEGMGLMAD